MEVDEIQTQPSKFSRINSNGKVDTSKLGSRPPNNDSSHNIHRQQYPDEPNHGREQQLCSALVATGTRATTSPALTGGGASALLAVGEVGGGAGSRLRSWQHSSRIIRVSRASGGKDRHSKVWTAKGPRDRRVRLSVTTAIQFYDLQDRLGFDQPSKAVEWLIKAAADSIAELPALNGTFPETPRQLDDEKRSGSDQLVLVGGDSSFDVDLDGVSGDDPNLAKNQTQNQPGSNLSKSSNCSSTSETSKGSGGLSLSRTEIRVKARERARVRTAKEKDKETDSTSARAVQSRQNANRQAISHQTTSSFTQLLTTGIGLVSDNHNDNNNNNTSGMDGNTSPQTREQQHQQWCNSMDYFSSLGLMGAHSSAPSRANQNHNHPTSGFIQLGNSMPTISPLMSLGGESSHPSELHHQHYPYGLQDHHLIVPAIPSTAGLSAGSSSGHYNLNFSISSSNSPGLAAFSNSTNNRGTLQSNSSQSHFLPHLQRFSSASSSAVDVSTQLPFLLGATIESHQHHPFPSGFQLCYGDNNNNVERHSDHRGKGKN